jgi:hypothetical protein
MALGRFRWLAVLAVLVLAVGRSGYAQDIPAHFNGLINDHTVPLYGSWEIHGVWTLNVQGASGQADFTAALNMERADLFFVLPPGPDPTSVAVRNAHTHHVAVTAGVLTFLANGFRVTGPATVTANGATPTNFGTDSTLQVDVTGGNLVSYANIALTFSGDAALHFGQNPLKGVVSAMK